MNLFEPPVEDLNLRPYQIKSVDMLRDSVSRHKKVILQAPCGCGKTVIAAHILKKASNNGMRCAFVVDRLTLVDQTSRVFGKYGISHGVIQGQHPLFDPMNNVQICSIQTLAKRSVEKFDFVVIDEVHSLFSAHEKLIKDAKYAIGLSGTPWRVGLGKHFNDLVIPISMKELIKNGDLLDYDVYSPSTIDTKGLRIVAGDYNSKDLAERSDTVKITGDIVSHWAKYADNQKTICFCCNISHAKHVAREFNRKGISATQVNSYQDTDGNESERQQAMDAFVKGDTRVICSVSILEKGFDFPEATVAILARPTKSKMVFVQQVGRVLRVGGGDRALILDHAGNFARHGFVEDIDIKELDDGKKKRGSSKEKKERDEPLPKACPSCDFLKPVGVPKCPACGLIPEHIEDVETEEGELAKLKRTKKEAKEYSLSEKQIWLGGLNTYAKSHGMSLHAKGFYGWALHKYKEKFGSWPSNKMEWSYQCGIIQDVDNYITYLNIKRNKADKSKSWTKKKKAKQLKPCDCGHPMVVEKAHDSKHKFALYCAECGKFNKFGRLKDQN